MMVEREFFLLKRPAWATPIAGICRNTNAVAKKTRDMSPVRMYMSVRGHEQRSAKVKCSCEYLRTLEIFSSSNLYRTSSLLLKSPYRCRSLNVVCKRKRRGLRRGTLTSPHLLLRHGVGKSSLVLLRFLSHFREDMGRLHRRPYPIRPLPQHARWRVHAWSGTHAFFSKSSSLIDWRVFYIFLSTITYTHTHTHTHTLLTLIFLFFHLTHIRTSRLPTQSLLFS